MQQNTQQETLRAKLTRIFKSSEIKSVASAPSSVVITNAQDASVASLSNEIPKETIESRINSFLEGCEKTKDVYCDSGSGFSVNGEPDVPLMQFKYTTRGNDKIFFAGVTPFVLYEIPKQLRVRGDVVIPAYRLDMKLGATIEEHYAEQRKYGDWRFAAEKQIEQVGQALQAAVKIIRLSGEIKEDDASKPDTFVNLFKEVQAVFTVTYTVNLANLVHAAERAAEELCFAKDRGFRNTGDAHAAFAQVASDKELKQQKLWTGTNLNPKLIGELRYQGFVAKYYTSKPEPATSEETGEMN